MTTATGFYDLDHDPNQLDSHFGDPRYARVQARLQRVWRRAASCRGAACQQPLPPSLRRGPTRERELTDRPSRGVERRYGHYR